MTEPNRTLQGIPASPGIVIGRVRVVSDFGDLQASFRLLYTEDERAAELERFHAAVDQAQEELLHLREKVAAEFPEHTHLLDLHLLIRASRNLSNDSVAPDISPILDIQPIEELADHGGGVRFLPTQFRILVEHAAKLNKTMS